MSFVEAEAVTMHPAKWAEEDLAKRLLIRGNAKRKSRNELVGWLAGYPISRRAVMVWRLEKNCTQNGKQGQNLTGVGVGEEKNRVSGLVHAAEMK